MWLATCLLVVSLFIGSVEPGSKNIDWDYIPHIMEDIRSEPLEKWREGVDVYMRYIGYNFEWRQFTTGDGVTIQLHHFWNGTNNETGIPVLLVHALLTNGDMWLLNAPDDAYPLLLANCGYDMWILNFRGSMYSPYKKENVSYTLDDCAREDLPLAIDFVLAERKRDDLHLVTMSKGSTVALALLSSKPTYNEKIRMLILLVPVTYFDEPITVARALLKLLGMFTGTPRVREKFIKSFDMNRYWIPLHWKFVGSTLQVLGKLFPRGENLVVNALWTSRISDQETCYNNSYTARALFRGYPGNWSHHELFQYGEMSCSNQFQTFNYKLVPESYRRNYDVTPYNLDNVTCEVNILEAFNDFFSQPKDYRRIRSQLKYLQGAYRVNVTNFQHVDPVIGKDTASIFGLAFVSLLVKYDVTDDESPSQCLDLDFAAESKKLVKMEKDDLFVLPADPGPFAPLSNFVKVILDSWSVNYCDYYGTPTGPIESNNFGNVILRIFDKLAMLLFSFF